MKYKTVITYGTFDLFHIGHLALLKRLAGMAEKVIVGVSTDEFNREKGKRTVIPYDQRAAIVEAICYVDEVIPESRWSQKISDIQAKSVDLFAIGDDWRGQFDHLKQYCNVMYLDRTKDVSTTGLKSALRKFTSVSREELDFALDVLSTLSKDLE